jgi:hypothetical protein
MINTQAANDWSTRATRAHSAATQSGPSPWQAAAHDTTLSNSQLLSAPGIRTAVNSAPRASLIHSMQRTHGNRAVQRQTKSQPPPVQRSLADMVEGLVGGGKPVTGGFLTPEEVDAVYNPSVSTGLMPADYFDGSGPAPNAVPALPGGSLSPKVVENAYNPFAPIGGLLHPDQIDQMYKQMGYSSSIADTMKRMFPAANLPGPLGPLPYAPFGPGSILPPMPGPSGPGERSKFKTMDDLLSWGGSKLGKATDFVADNPGVVLSLLGGGFGGGKEKETDLFDDPLKWAGETADLAVDDPLGAVKKAWQHTPLGYAAKETNEFFTGKPTIGPDGKPRRGPSSFDRGVDAVFNSLAEGTRSIADEVEDVPIIGGLADAGADAAEIGTRVQAGVWKQAGGMIGGLSGMVADPMSAPKKAWERGENSMLPTYANPFRLAHAGYDVISGEKSLGDAYDEHLDPANAVKQQIAYGTGMLDTHLDPYKQAYERGDYMEMAGRAGFDLAMLAFGGGSARGGQAGRGGRPASVVDDVGGVNPRAKTMPGSGNRPVDPYGPTHIDAPPVSPYSPTQPGITPISPTAPTQPGLTPISPTAPTQPGITPISPTAPTVPIPAQPGISPKAYTIPPRPQPGISPKAETLTPQPLPYAPTLPVLPPGPTIPGMPTIPGVGGAWNTLLDFVF